MSSWFSPTPRATSPATSRCLCGRHQHARVGGLPDQQWPLRVTLVFRRGETDWELVHRHADLTVKRITLEQAAALARGDAFASGSAQTR